MAVRIANPPLNNTEQLLERILLVIMQDESRALFTCPAGEGEAILQRMRVMISRKRKELQAKGKRVRKFRLRSTIHIETHAGIRYDACVCWRQVSESNVMSEELEGILSNG